MLQDQQRCYSKGVELKYNPAKGVEKNFWCLQVRTVFYISLRNNTKEHKYFTFKLQLLGKMWDFSNQLKIGQKMESGDCKTAEYSINSNGTSILSWWIPFYWWRCSVEHTSRRIDRKKLGIL